MSHSESQDWLQTELKDTTILGAPMESRGRTLIPVASAPAESGRFDAIKFWKSAQAKPMGFLVLSDRTTRFVKVQDRRWLLLGAILGAIALIVLIAGIGMKGQKRARKPALW